MPKEQKKLKKQIDPDMLIAEMAEMYPEVVNFLIYEYQFHCVGCFISQFETLRQGAQTHGIEGEDYEEMIANINRIINGEDAKDLTSPSSAA